MGGRELRLKQDKRLAGRSRRRDTAGSEELPSLRAKGLRQSRPGSWTTAAMDDSGVVGLGLPAIAMPTAANGRKSPIS